MAGDARLIDGLQGGVSCWVWWLLLGDGAGAGGDDASSPLVTLVDPVRDQESVTVIVMNVLKMADIEYLNIIGFRSSPSCTHKPIRRF